jgi:hypothetical protein
MIKAIVNGTAIGCIVAVLYEMVYLAYVVMAALLSGNNL